METTLKSKMAPDEYLGKRVEEQFAWYEGKSALMKRNYYRCKVIVIVSSALIPLLVGFSDSINENLKYVADALGAVVAITEGILSLKKYRENWLIYRTTAESLNREKIFLVNRVGPYGEGDESELFKKFVERAEQIMASENSSWMSASQAKTDENAG